MNIDNPQAPISRYRQLARQIGVIRRVLPLALAFIVFGVETSEHLMHEENPFYLDFSLEVVMFRLAGPAIIAGVLNWIVKNLELLAIAYEKIEAFNAELDKKSSLEPLNWKSPTRNCASSII